MKTSWNRSRSRSFSSRSDHQSEFDENHSSYHSTKQSSHHHDSHSYSHHHQRKIYHGHHRQRCRAESRRHHDNSSSHKHSSHRSRSHESGHDDSHGHYIGEKGRIVNNCYEIIKELGTGTFARAFEVRDINTNKHYALKVVRSIHRYCKSAKIEARIMRDVSEHDKSGVSHCCHLYDEFEFDGHYCILVDLLGSSLYDIMKINDYRSFPMKTIQFILYELLQALDFIHSMGLTHTDLKLENILFNSRDNNFKKVNHHQESIFMPEDSHITLIDFGGAMYDDENRSCTINTRQYRAPEVLLGLKWDEESDIWGVGCIAMELFDGDVLFQTHDDLLHFALIEKIIGKIPEKMLRNASSRKQRYFDKDGWFLLDELHHSEIAHVKRMETLKERIAKDYPEFYDLVSGCLVISPERRFTAAEALKHPFFKSLRNFCVCFSGYGLFEE